MTGGAATGIPGEVVPAAAVRGEGRPGALLARPETAGAARGLPDREIGPGACGRWLSFVARELRTNQLPMNGAFLNSVLGRAGRDPLVGIRCRLILLRRFFRRDAEHGAQLSFLGQLRRRW
jgi:hypothetical protein